MTNNTFTSNVANAAASGHGGAVMVNSAHPVTLRFNRFFNNSASGAGSGVYQPTGSGSVTDATENWWGCNAGPGNAKTWRESSGEDDALFAELLTFSEPRLYLQQILGNLYHYARLYRD